MQKREEVAVGGLGGGVAEDWTLHVSNVQPGDMGGWMCQVNTLYDLSLSTAPFAHWRCLAGP